MINFDKMRMMAKRVNDITSLGLIEYKYESNDKIQACLMNPIIIHDLVKLKQLSLECEPNTNIN